MITRVYKLKRPCKRCGNRADFEVTRPNDELPANYVQSGERTIAFCAEHLDPEAKAMWNDEFNALEAEGLAPIVKEGRV